MASDPGDLQPLSLDALCWRCDAKRLTFRSTEELEDLADAIGQDRAVEAIHFSIGMERPGYNLFALGPDGTGKHTLVRHHLDAEAKRGAAPFDWCHISNFRELRKPQVLRLAAGRGAVFQADMARFADELRAALRSAFEGDQYRTSRQVIEEAFKERQEQAMAAVEEEGRAQNIALMRTPAGFVFAPVSEGKVVTPEVFQSFPEAEQKRIETAIEELQKKLQEELRQTPLWMKETRDKLRKLNDETAMFAVGHMIAALRARYEDLPEVLSYLDDVSRDVIENVETIIAAPEKAGPDGVSAETADGHPLFRRYRVNLIVDNAGQNHAPVVYEDDPTYDRLLGRIEHRAEMGTLVTDFHLIRAGALHRANGGYLILDAHKLLTRPMAWEGLKRALKAGEVRIEPAAQAMGLLSTVTLEPEPIAIDVKIVLVGERRLYYLLSELDPDFGRLFKVAADFDERIERSDENNLLYARLIATIARREQLRPLDCSGVARALEFSARQSGDAERLSTQLEELADVLREADYWAGVENRSQIATEDMQRAIDAKIYRLDRVRERIQEEIRRGTVTIDTDGTAIGQVNGLSVMQLGGFAFGRPSRITARIRLGKGEVIDIEREVALGGPLHSKGVLILSGYLSAHYAPERPLSLAASLVFEQSYGGVDGDSASSTELYALLSAIAEVPIKQGFAVTGSVDQYGRVQAIGGVNEKIEGFFDLCDARGLTGEQAVLIPAANVKHLMLDRRVVEAAGAGRFRIHAVETIAQGIEILTGMPAGERGADGAFPDGTINHLVEARLIQLAEARRAFGRSDREASES